MSSEDSRDLRLFWAVGPVDKEGAHIAEFPLTSEHLEMLIEVEEELRSLDDGERRFFLRARRADFDLGQVRYIAARGEALEELGSQHRNRRDGFLAWCKQGETTPYGLVESGFFDVFDTDRFDRYSAPLYPNHYPARLRVKRDRVSFQASQDFARRHEEERNREITVRVSKLRAWRALLLEPPAQREALDDLINRAPRRALELIEGIQVLSEEGGLERMRVVPTTQQASRLLSSPRQQIRQRALMALKKIDAPNLDFDKTSLSKPGGSSIERS